MPAGVTVYTVQTTNVTLLTTELNALAASGYFTSSVGGSSGIFNNCPQTIGAIAPTANMGGYLRGKVTMTLANPSGAFAAGSILGLWFLHSIDGSTFEVASASNPRPFDLQIPLPPVITQVPVAMDVKIPAGCWKVGGQYVPASGTQAFAATGNSVVVEMYTAGQ